MEPFVLDDATRARAEAAGEGPEVEFHGVTFTFPSIRDVTWLRWEKLDANLTRSITDLLGGQADKFWELEPTVIDMVTLKDHLLTVYAGALSGESRASRDSSVKTGGRSRRPSGASTTKTS